MSALCNFLIVIDTTIFIGY